MNLYDPAIVPEEQGIKHRLPFRNLPSILERHSFCVSTQHSGLRHVADCIVDRWKARESVDCHTIGGGGVVAQLKHGIPYIKLAH